jgi:predicted NBD/HSP70 family sugar kinase
MTKINVELAQLPAHGSTVLPSVEVKSYNLEVEDEDGFVGDKASRRMFWRILDKWRKPLKELGEDPFGDAPSEAIGKKKLAALLVEGDPHAAGTVQSAVEEFAQQLTSVIARFLRLKHWRDMECLVIGGGFRASRLGELVIGRSAVLLKSDGLAVDLKPISSDPDEAGLMGAAHLLPAWMLKGHEAILAVDVGGTNIRTGLVQVQSKKSGEFKTSVCDMTVWRHADEEIKREDAVGGLVEMLEKHIARAKKEKMRLAPLIGAKSSSSCRDMQKVPQKPNDRHTP